jgi:DNA-binding transcriptional MerR regulator
MSNPAQSPTKDLPASAASWTIADIQRETGLGKDTLRVWEKRYGFPRPVRDENGERLYPADQLQQLRLIKRLLDADHRPGKVVGQSLEQLQMLLDQPAAKTRLSNEQRAQMENVQALEEPWLKWLANDEVVQIKQALQRKIVRHGLSQVVDKTFAPLCQLVGEGWMQGQISIYQEHLFTEILQGVLREAISSVDGVGGDGKYRPRILLTTTPNEQHSLGLLMAECQFAIESCERFVLGTSTPVSEMIEAVERLKIDVLALSFSAHATRTEVIDSLKRLKSQLPEQVEVWIGGAGAKAFARSVPEGIRVLQSSEDIARQISAWRQQHAGNVQAIGRNP